MNCSKIEAKICDNINFKKYCFSQKMWNKNYYSILLNIIFKLFYLFIFREREGKEREREKNINVWLPLMCSPMGTWLTTQAYSLTGNQTSDPLLYRPMLNPLSYTSRVYFAECNLNDYLIFINTCV